MTALPLRFWRRVDITDTCWLWRTPMVDGYGRFQLGWVRKRAHQWTWEALHGPVPDGMCLDHLCRVRACCNPAHLRVVTPAENTMAPGSRAMGRIHAERVTCPQGHPYDRVYDGKRRCSICLSAQNRASKARRRAA